MVKSYDDNHKLFYTAEIIFKDWHIIGAHNVYNHVAYFHEDETLFKARQGRG